MPKAWAQVAAILQANKLIKASVFMMKVALQFTLKTLSQIPQNSLLAISRPVLSRVLGSPTTVLQQIMQSNTPAAVFSGAFRRMVRPRGKLVQKLGNFDYGQLVTGLNSGTLSVAPVSVTPAGLPNTQEIATQLTGPTPPAWLLWLAAHRLWLLILILVLCILLAILTGAWIWVGLLAAAGIAAYIYLGTVQANATVATDLDNPQAALASIATVPPAAHLLLAPQR